MTGKSKISIDLFRNRLWILALLLLTLSALTAGATGDIAVSNTFAVPGSSVSVPVVLSAATDIAGVNIRIEYDSAVFSSPSVSRGSLMEDNHLLFSTAPEAGRLCVLAYSFDAIPFNALAGTVFSINLNVDQAAAEGDYPVSFTVAQSGSFPSSGLTDLAGHRVEHMQTGGIITLGQPIPYDINRDGTVDAKDLLLFCSDWTHSPTAQRCNFDQEGTIDHIDLYMFSEWWLYQKVQTKY